MGYFFSSLSKSVTESLLDASEIVLIISGFVLFFGAVGEYLEAHGKLPRWMKWPKLVFIVMVVVSLVGEFLGDAGVFVFSSHLQAISEAEFTALNREAGNARKSAGAANERAGIAEQKAGEANERASKNERESATLRKQASGLQKRAEDEYLARVQLEEKIAPRHITDEQRDKIRSAIRDLTPVPIALASCLGDTESGQYAYEVQEALGPKWTKVGIDEHIWKIPSPRGFSIAVSPSDLHNSTAVLLQRAFRSAGIRLHAEVDPTLGSGQIELRVYFKPLPNEIRVEERYK